MNISAIILVVLRLIHIVTAVSWFGVSFAALLFIRPAAQAAGEAGWRFTKALYGRTRFGSAFPVWAVITVVTGILLYLTGDPTTNFSRTGQIVLGIGAVIGLLAAGHGLFAMGPITMKLTTLMASSIQDSGAIASTNLQQLEAENAKFGLHVRLSFAMTALALLFMATARYL